MTQPFGKQLPSMKTRPPGPATVDWISRLAAVECPAITARRDRRKDRGGKDPIVWKRARGSNVEDVDGNVYVDLAGGFAVASIGHAHPAVVEAIQRQSESLIHGMGDLFPTREKVELAEKLAAVTPDGLDQTIFGANGSDAVEAALKTALIATGKPRVLGFQGGYHGMSLGALGVSGYRNAFREPFRDFAGARELRLPFPGMPGSPHEDDDGTRSLEEIRWLLSSPASGGDSIGALIVEPIQGRGGVVEPPAGWLRGLRELCDEFDLLLIYDEIYTGFGRTGRWFAMEHEGVVPDLACVGKSMGGGVPISACIGSTETMAGWGRSEGESIHTSTFLGNPMNAAAALATIQVLESERLVERSERLGAELKDTLAERTAEFAKVGVVRGKGMMLGIPLLDAQGSAAGGAAVQAMFDLLEEGVMVSPGGTAGEVISLAPAFNIESAQLDVASDRLIAWLEQYDRS
jgi:4-aminobutyrate aminotransferase-like enzyme